MKRDTTFEQIGPSDPFRRLVDALAEAVAMTDAAGRVVFINRAWRRDSEARGFGRDVGAACLEVCRRVYGLPERLPQMEPLVRTYAHSASHLSDSDASNASLLDSRAGIENVLRGVWPSFSAVYSPSRTGTSDPLVQGLPHWLELNVTQLEGGGAVLSYRDISDQKRCEARLYHQAHHDALTGLPNRRAFVQEAQEALSTAAAQGAPLTLLYLDLDDFKSVNDHYGHDVGDALLETIAARLKGQARRHDLLARLGGDEFALLLRNVTPEASVELVRRLERGLAQPFSLLGHTLYAEGSFGAAHYPEAGTTLEALLTYADGAMYELKAARKRARRAHRTAASTRTANR